MPIILGDVGQAGADFLIIFVAIIILGFILELAHWLIHVLKIAWDYFLKLLKRLLI